MANSIHYAEFLYPGLLFTQSSVVMVADPKRFDVPRAALGYRVFQRTSQTVDGEQLLGEARDHTPWTYIGRAWTLEEVERTFPGKRVLVDNMRGNGYRVVVQTHAGMWLPVQDGDRVIEAVPA